MTKHVNLRLQPEMHTRLVAAAERTHRSLNGLIEECCEQWLALHDLRGKEIRRKDGDPRNLDPASLEVTESDHG